MPTPTSKVCTGCKIEKPLEKFYRNSNGRLGRYSRCKVCERGRNIGRRRVKVYTVAVYKKLIKRNVCGRCGERMNRRRETGWICRACRPLAVGGGSCFKCEYLGECRVLVSKARPVYCELADLGDLIRAETLCGQRYMMTTQDYTIGG